MRFIDAVSLRLVTALVALLAAGCLASPPVQVAGGEIKNLARTPVHEVEAVHHPTGATTSINTILAGQSLQLSFRSRELRAKSATIRWRSAAGGSHSQEVRLPECPEELRDAPVWVVYSIHTDGRVTCALEARPSTAELLTTPPAGD
jgi:hypothetical protein